MFFSKLDTLEQVAIVGGFIPGVSTLIGLYNANKIYNEMESLSGKVTRVASSVIENAEKHVENQNKLFIISIAVAIPIINIIAQIFYCIVLNDMFEEKENQKKAELDQAKAESNANIQRIEEEKIQKEKDKQETVNWAIKLIDESVPTELKAEMKTNLDLQVTAYPEDINNKNKCLRKTLELCHKIDNWVLNCKASAEKLSSDEKQLHKDETKNADAITEIAAQKVLKLEEFNKFAQFMRTYGNITLKSAEEIRNSLKPWEKEEKSFFNNLFG